MSGNTVREGSLGKFSRFLQLPVDAKLTATMGFIGTPSCRVYVHPESAVERVDPALPCGPVGGWDVLRERPCRA